MADWMDAGWQDFVETYSLQGVPSDALTDMKEAWLHGARTAVAKASEAVNAFMEATKAVEE